jgi:biotin carboxylase
MSTTPPQSDRARLVVAYSARSIAMMTIAQEARALCDVIWLIDESEPPVAQLLPLLRRLGTVVAVLAEPPDRIAAALAPLVPDGIVTFTDEHLGRLAQVAALLGLPFHDPQTARNLEDKLFQRQALRAAGLVSPPVVALSSGDEPGALRELAARIDYPAVLKPRRASGSWHTFRVDEAGELLTCLAGLADEPPEAMVAEGYLSDGPPLPHGFEAGYVSVESVVHGGQIRHVTTTGRLPLTYPLRETGFFIPSTLGGAQLAAVLDLAGRALRAVGIQWGITHTEIKLTADGPAVIEINGRIGGGIPEMLRQVTDIDLIAAAMQLALGTDPGLATLPATGGIGYRFFYQPPLAARRLRSITGVEQLRALPGVDRVGSHLTVGAALDAGHGSRTFLFDLVGRCNSYEELSALSQRLYSTVQAVYETADGGVLVSDGKPPATPGPGGNRQDANGLAPGGRASGPAARRERVPPV